MGLRFRKSIKICKGVRVNLSNSGPSLSFGVTGLRATVNSKGRVSTSVGIPGTGLSYSKSFGGKKSSKKTTKKDTKKQTAASAETAQAVESHQELLDEIRSIHKGICEPIDWANLKNAPAPFDPNGIGPREAEAQKALDKASSGLFAKLAGKKKRQPLEEAVEEARKLDQEAYQQWESLRQLSDGVLKGDPDSYLYVVAEMQPFDDILEYGSDFDVGTDEPDIIEVEFHVKSEEVVPEETISLTKTGKVSTKAMTKTMRCDIIQDYICSCVIRIAREMFALLPVERALIHAVDSVLDTSTGHEEEVTVLSVLMEREMLSHINLERVDPSEALNHFECNMDFKKTQGLKPVERIEL